MVKLKVGGVSDFLNIFHLFTVVFIINQLHDTRLGLNIPIAYKYFFCSGKYVLDLLMVLTCTPEVPDKYSVPTRSAVSVRGSFKGPDAINKDVDSEVKFSRLFHLDIKWNMKINLISVSVTFKRNS